MEASCRALGAGAAGRDDAEADVVPGRDVGDGRPHRLDDARPLVTQDDRPATVAELTVGKAHVRVAHARCGDANEHFVVAGRSELDLLYNERLPRLVEDGGANAHQPTR